MRVDDIRGAGRSQKPADARGVNPPKGGRHRWSAGGQGGETHLTGRRSDDLRERPTDRDAGSGLARLSQQDVDPAVVACEGDGGAGDQPHPGHYAGAPPRLTLS